jgi:hypothetical protein
LAEIAIAFIIVGELTQFDRDPAMTQTDSLTAHITDLVTATATLKTLLAADREPAMVTEICEKIAVTAAAITVIGPVAPQPSGLYGAWSEVVLALGAAKNCEFTGLALARLDGAIDAVRTLRRTFGLAPGGA